MGVSVPPKLDEKLSFVYHPSGSNVEYIPSKLSRGDIFVILLKNHVSLSTIFI